MPPLPKYYLAYMYILLLLMEITLDILFITPRFRQMHSEDCELEEYVVPNTHKGEQAHGQSRSQ